MAGFADLDSFMDPSLHLPIRGRVYKIPSPDAETGLFVQRLVAAAATAMTGGKVSEKDAERIVLDDDKERDLYQRILGPAWDEMFADQLPWAYITHAGSTVLIWISQGQEAAEAFWGAEAPKGPEPEPGSAVRAAMAAQTNSDSHASSTPRNSSRRKGTPGKKSSSTGS